ncbi:hypothetical protein LTR36_001755 [Oleoguttula mirabilis]|uniref:Uncharacterized protein n=1 Tax=Oleoguttula mirabilis TaxID=1507867 RepID=A0AAV9JMP0_9PEZI|nr:hypothetical protein LTR36_001755 [Oleoguttula mirabilis]
MAEGQKSGDGGDGLLDMEKELTCSICTDILYQPLTLLDCLHTFCGSCLREWFAWQAASATTNRRTTHPYTCPSCRDSVRGTKADWRLTTLLEGYLKANPDRAKSDDEKEEMRKHYKPGDNVTPKVEIRREESDSEDERLLAEVRDLSMANVDPETARRRADRAARSGRHRRREDGASGTNTQYRSLQEHDADEPQVEHQPSLRSLLSASPIQSLDVQQEIVRSIYADGLLDGIDIDNLTPEQEEELTERIAEAYRRRQRRRDRSGTRERRTRNERSPPQRTSAGAENQSRHHARTESASSQQPRTRPPVSRPHLFEQNLQEPATRHGRSVSSTRQRANRSASRTDGSTPVTPASRSATDLSERPTTAEAARDRRRRLSSNARSTTDPQGDQLRTDARRMRATSGNNRDVSSEVIQSAHPLEVMRRQAGPANNSSPSLPTSFSNTAPTSQFAVRPATSTAGFAPEHIASTTPVPELVSATHTVPITPSLSCKHCNKADIQYTLHYHCPWCRNGSFDLCLSCYRDGQGCDHWYGFGYMAYERWRRLAPPEGWPTGYERPHTLVPRRYVKQERPLSSQEPEQLQEGAFCESCSAFANECYWYCFHCLEGAWGFCNACAQQGRHCTHPLLPVAHQNSLRQAHPDPAKASFAQMPHLRQDSYVVLPVLTDCDICRRPIPPNSTRFHCHQCSNGDYDICTECYYSLVATGKISQANGPNSWRRCLQGHRMTIVGYQDMPEGGQQRVIVRGQVGGRRHKDEDADVAKARSTAAPPPADSSLGARCLSLWSYFPREGVADELTFPKNAEVTEMDDMNGDWSIGVYAGNVGLFPSNHVRKL